MLHYPVLSDVECLTSVPSYSKGDETGSVAVALIYACFFDNTSIFTSQICTIPVQQYLEFLTGALIVVNIHSKLKNQHSFPEHKSENSNVQ